MSFYMKIENIEGQVSAKGFEKWVELDSFKFGVSRSINTKPGYTSDRESSKPSLSEITVTKSLDKTSPLLFSEACVGKAKGKVEIHFCQTGENIASYMQYILTNVIISNYQVSAANNESRTAPMESISLNYDKIEMRYIPYDEKHSAGTPFTAGYNQTTAEKL